MTDSKRSDKEKVILHMDGDAFFVAVEVARNPALKGLPVVTGGERGIVSALSYEAKALGVTRTMPIQRVKKQFPQVVVCNSDYKSYRIYSKKMFDIVRRYADDVEEYSIDECFADLTGLDKPLRMSYEEIAKRIKKEVSEELRLSVTIGLAPTKVLAKVASKWQKPDGFTVITLENVKSFLETFPISKVWGIGPKTSSFLEREGVRTAFDFSKRDMRWVLANLSSNYLHVWKELQGVSVNMINQETKTTYASIQRMHTFYPATNDKRYLLSELSRHVEGACYQARKYSLVAKKCLVTLRDQKLRYVSVTIMFTQATNAPEIIIGLLEQNFEKIYKEGVLYRATGVTLQGLEKKHAVQTSLFDFGTTRSEKFEVIHKEIDLLERKFRKKVVHLGSTHQVLSEDTPLPGDDHLLFL
jgi:DNA polymerase-4/DNA polymerase V